MRPRRWRIGEPLESELQLILNLPPSRRTREAWLERSNIHATNRSLAWGLQAMQSELDE
jgi:hypothetical protein